MNDIQNHNLDYLAAKHAQALVEAASKEAEKILTKTLGVLQENGVYACFLYLFASGKDDGYKIKNEMLELLGEARLGFPQPPEKNPKNDAVLNYVAEEITADLPTLLLAKEALEQMLIYARYGAKAAGK